jgi:hypothetical protein
MGGASSASSVPAASAAGGYSSQAAMSGATIGGTTGSNVAGMGWVPQAQQSSAFRMTPSDWKTAGGIVGNVAGTIGDAVGSQNSGMPSMPSAPSGGTFTPVTSTPIETPSYFAGLAQAMPLVSPGIPRLAMSPGRMSTAPAGYGI